MRVLKPGGHMAVFAGARTQDLMGLSIRLAGFEIRDTLGWVYGSGFPKSMDISKAIDKARREDAEPVKAVAKALRAALDASGKTRKEIDAHFGTANVSQYWFSPHRNSQVPPVDKWPWLRDFLGIDSSLDAEVWRLNGRKGTPGEAWEKREVTGVYEQPNGVNEWAGNYMGTKKAGIKERRDIPATSEAAKWDGWGTALKPAIEPIILARKPLDGTVAGNVLAHGVGGLNIDASRVGSGTGEPKPEYVANDKNQVYGAGMGGGAWVNASGRFPANVLLDEHAAKEMDKQSGVLKGRVGMTKHGSGTNSVYGTYERSEQSLVNDGRADSGGASRFFPVFKYQAKAPKKERPVLVREDGTKVQHPTVKPLALMEWLVTLITPEGGTVLDPFAGTGTTLQAATNKGFNPIGIEQDADYIKLINKRLGQ